MNTLFFYSNLYLTFLRSSCENIFKVVCIVSEKIGKKSQNLPYCSSLQSVVVYNLLKLKVLFQCRSEITWPTLYGSVTWFSFVWWGKVNRTDCSMKEFSLNGSFFFYICCNLPVAQNILPRQQIFIQKSVSSFPTSCSFCIILEFLLLWCNQISQPFS